jgi:hypothetical protein
LSIPSNSKYCKILASLTKTRVHHCDMTKSYVYFIGLDVG